MRQILVCCLLLLALRVGAQNDRVQSTTDGLNIRAGATTKSAVLGQLNTGDQLPCLGTTADGSWFRVLYGDAEAFVSARYAELLLKNSDAEPQPIVSGEPAVFPCPMKLVTVGKMNYNVADITDYAQVYGEAANKANCFFVVSKQEYRLYVYEVLGQDTVLRAHYPICYAKNPGPKTRTGDMSTPECSLNAPARIKQIQSSGEWTHDFKDGRGSIPSYGAWFMRLDLSQSDCHPGCRTNPSIGIHGSTNNRASVPGRNSEGCIRLRDEDIRDLKSRFSAVGVRVVIKPINQGKLPFEMRAEAAAVDYHQAVSGYSFVK